jgi:uncharacterized membrane protein YeaQ/YmgE (transglycosylase-associated protein family)
MAHGYIVGTPPQGVLAVLTPLGLLILLLVAAVVGSVGQALAGYSLGGCLVSIVLGFLGAFVGAWLAGALGLPALLPITVDGQSIPLIWAVVGAAIVSFVVGSLTRRRTPPL